MKKIFNCMVVGAVILWMPKVSLADTLTSRLGLTLPTIGSPTWGQKLNTNFQILDATSTVVSGSLLVATGTSAGAFTTVASSQTSDLLFETSQFNATLPAGNTVYIKVIALPSVTTVGVSSLTVTTNALFSTATVSVSASTITWSNGSYQSGSYTDNSTVTYAAALMSGTRTDNSTITFSGTSMSGTKTDNSTTNGTRTDNSTVTTNGSWTFNQLIAGTTMTLTNALDPRITQAATSNSSFVIIDQNVKKSDGVAQRWLLGSGISDFIGTFTLRNFTGSTDIISASTSTNGVSIHGTNTNDNAPVGDYGEYVSTRATTAVGVGSSGAWTNMVSTVVTAGDWDFTGVIDLALNGASITNSFLAISIGSGASTGDQVVGDNQITIPIPVTALDGSATIPNYHIQVVSGTQTVYLKTFITYATATPQMHCRLSGRRPR